MSMADNFAVRKPQYENIPRKTDIQVVVPRFFRQEVETDQVDPDTGLKVFRSVEYVELLIPGDRGNAPVKRVTDEIRFQFRDAYERFKSSGAQHDMVGDGIPLKLWSGIKSEQARGLEQVNIFTVQQLAGLSDTNCSQPGTLGLRALRDKARQFLDAARETAPVAALQAQIDELRKDAALKAQQLQEMIEKNTQLQSQVSAAGGGVVNDQVPDLTTPRGRNK